MITMDDKYRFEDFGFMCEPGYQDPLTPNFERKTLAIPGKVGIWDFGVEIRERPLSYPLKIMDRLHERMEYQFNKFKDFWFDAYGQPREVKIVRDIEPDKFYMVKVSTPLLPQRLEEEGNFTLPLVANEGLKHLNVMTNEIHWDSETATFDDTWSMDTVHVEDKLITAPVTVEPYVNGYAITPTILITGSADSVTFQANGKSFSLKPFTNATIEIRKEGYTVLKNGVETLSLMTGKFLDLLPGLNQVQISGSNMNFNLSIIFRDNYL